MGLTVLSVEIANPAQPSKTRAVEFLVDSGAIYSVVPAYILRGLRIKPIATQEFRLADGRVAKPANMIALSLTAPGGA